MMSGSSQHDASPGTRPPDASRAAGAPGSGVLALPVGVDGNAWDWPARIGLAVYHALALLAFLPWFFSWTGVVLAALGLYVYGTLGINLCYHRILTHRGLSVPKWLERLFVTLGICCLQDTPARWIAIHRLHHQHADLQRDPHSPLVTLLWGHVGGVAVLHEYPADVPPQQRHQWAVRVALQIRMLMMQTMYRDPACRRVLQAANAERDKETLQPFGYAQSPVRQYAVIAEIYTQRAVNVKTKRREHHAGPRKKPRQEGQKCQRVIHSKADPCGPVPGVAIHADRQRQHSAPWRSSRPRCVGGSGARACVVLRATAHHRELRRRGRTTTVRPAALSHAQQRGRVPLPRDPSPRLLSRAKARA